MTASADAPGLPTPAPSDAQLIAEVRAGATEAYGQLFERHHSAAVGIAYRYARNASDAEDLAAEGFASVLTALLNGSGPEAFFRAYLFTSIARLAARGNAKASRQTPSDEMERFEGEQPYDDPVLAGFESDAVSKAFRTLPERWQAVLWYTEIDRMQPAAVAPLLGLTPNAVSALALRAREGLRQAYLQAHVAEAAVADGCAPFADRLGALVRGGLSPRNEKKVREHVENCPRCTAALLQLRDVGHGMRAVVFPLVTALPFIAAGKIVRGGLVVGGADWLRRATAKLGVANAVLVALAAVTLVAGAAAVALLVPSAPGPSAPEPSAVAAGPTASSAGETSSPASSHVPPSGRSSATGAAPSEAVPPAAVPGWDAEPAAALPYAAPGEFPAAAALQTTTVAAPSASTAAPATSPHTSPPAGLTTTPPQSPSASATSSPPPTAAPYALTATLTRTAGVTGSADTIQLKSTPARAPTQPTEAVVTVRYASVVQPAWGASGWSCSMFLGPVLPATTLTCTTPFTGGSQIPALTFEWSISPPPTIGGEAVLTEVQTGTAVSNRVTF